MANRTYQRSKNLAYRLPENVTYYEKNGIFQLVLDFPLKAIFLHLSWKPVVERLSGGTFVPLEEISPLIKDTAYDKIELFLSDLSRKGFLEQEGISKLTDYPSVSIIIPVRNRPMEIEACLDSLSQLIYPSEKLEIIVVDDASTDNTLQSVSKFPVRLIALKENKQASFCRNLAAREARGTILAFIDSDCLADPLWLQDLIPAFKDSSLGAVGGMVDAYFKKSSLDRYEEVKSSLIVGLRVRRSLEDEKFFYLPSCNLLVRRNLFLELGGFREELFVGEDVDFCWRLQDAGHHVEFRPVGRVFHKHRNRLKPFCARRFDYGTSEPLLQRLHPKRNKQMVFPLGGSLFWGMAILAIFLEYSPLLTLCGIIVLTDAFIRRASITRKAVPITFPHLFIAVVRSYFAFFYHCCAFVSRYYLICSILIIPLLPLTSIIILIMHLFTGFMEYFIKKPRINLFSFFFYFSLEQLSYQSGVWWGCLKNLSFNAVNPRIAGSPLSKVSDDRYPIKASQQAKHGSF